MDILKKFIIFPPFPFMNCFQNNDKNLKNEEIKVPEDNKKNEKKLLNNKTKRNNDGNDNNLEGYTIIKEHRNNKTEIIKPTKKLFKNALNNENLKNAKIKEENIKNEKDSRIFHNKNLINDKYSYKVISPDLAKTLKSPPKDITKLEFNLILKNDGINDWPEDSTFLINDKKDTSFLSNFDRIKLGPLKVNQEIKVKIELKDLKLEVKNQQLVLNFSVDNKIYGDKINIKFQVVEHNNVYKFREKYNIDDSMGTDEEIEKILKESPNFEYAYNNFMSKFVIG